MLMFLFECQRCIIYRVKCRVICTEPSIRKFKNISIALRYIVWLKEWVSRAGCNHCVRYATAKKRNKRANGTMCLGRGCFEYNRSFILPVCSNDRSEEHTS